MRKQTKSLYARSTTYANGSIFNLEQNLAPDYTLNLIFAMRRRYGRRRSSRRDIAFSPQTVTETGALSPEKYCLMTSSFSHRPHPSQRKLPISLRDRRWLCVAAVWKSAQRKLVKHVVTLVLSCWPSRLPYGVALARR